MSGAGRGMGASGAGPVRAADRLWGAVQQYGEDAGRAGRGGAVQGLTWGKAWGKGWAGGSPQRPGGGGAAEWGGEKGPP